MLEQTRPLEAFRALSMLVLAESKLAGSLTFECIAAIKVDSSLSIDRELWCPFGRRECILGWYLKVDHNYVKRFDPLTDATIVCVLDGKLYWQVLCSTICHPENLAVFALGEMAHKPWG